MDYRKSKAWQRCDDLAVAVYEASRTFPKAERYDLTSQMRRAAVSIAANIAEGSGRATRRDYLRFLYQARGSLREVEYYIHLARRLGYLSEAAARTLQATSNEAGSTLHGLITYWEQHCEDGEKTSPQSDTSSPD